jgi:hypothetical protein
MPNAIIKERGNGFPDVGDYVAGAEGEVYSVTEFRGPIQTSGGGNWIRAVVELADWSDVTDDNEPICGCTLDDESDDA